MAVQEYARFLYREAGGKGGVVFGGAVLAGLLQGGILYAILNGVQEYNETGQSSIYSYACFLFGLVLYFIVYRHTTRTSVEAALSFITRSQKNIAAGLRQARYYEFTQLNQAEVYAALSGNTGLITESARFLPNCLSASVLLCISLVYAASVSVAGFVGLLALFAGVALMFTLLEGGGRQIAERAGKAQQRFLSGIQSLFGGFVELKMNPNRAEALFATHILPACDMAAEEARRYEDVHMRGNSLYSVLNFIPTGRIVFVAPFYAEVSTETMLTFVAVAMFCIPALVNLAMFAPVTGKALDIVYGIRGLEEKLRAMREASPGKGFPEANGAVDAQSPRHEEFMPAPPAFFKAVTVASMTFSYPAENPEASFSLEIDSFAVNKGELALIRGGNGSGKSTFFRVLAGLLPANTGAPAVDGVPLADMDIDSYRSLFSCVFTDFYLFDSLMGIEASKEEVAEALALVQLSSKIKMTQNGAFSTIDLSTGQRKRLALACAILEKRPILLLDEVAADFDPQFRDFFYRELLPVLKSKGRTIVAISHDDRYFGEADRVITMEYGRMTGSVTGKEAALQAMRLAGKGK